MQLDLFQLLHESLRGARASDPPLRAQPPAPPAIDIRGFDFVRVRRARRYVLRVRPDGRVRVTIPRGGSRAEAARFAYEQAAWIERERARVRRSHAAIEWTPGTRLLLRGQPVVVSVQERDGCRVAVVGDRIVAIPQGAVDLRPAIERHLRALAAVELVPRLCELAATHELSPGRVTIRSQRARWGSCSRSGAIALNFRLVQMPPEVADYVLVHELMHLRHQNHSVRFWRAVERAYPAFRDAERWLKTEGRALF